MYLKPCRNCPHKEGCEIKTEKLAAIRGLGFTSVNFRCDKRLSLLRPGTRVRLTLVVDQEERGGGYHPDEPPYLEPVEDERTGTAMRPHGVRILVWLDEMTFMGRNPIAVQPDRVTPLDEPLVKLCPECGQPEGTVPVKRADGRIEFVCLTCRPGPLDAPDAGGTMPA